MKVVDQKITIKELKEMSERMFGDLVKAVVDVEKEVMVVDAGMHVDEEAYLLGSGSRQEHLWGINIFPQKEGEGFIEFESMINLRPSFGNMSREVESQEVQEKIIRIVSKLVER